MKLKTGFKGTGSMEKFVAECDKLFQALSNVKFRMPRGYAGKTPSVRIEGDKKHRQLVFDMEDAHVFSLSNTRFVLTGSAEFTSYRAEVKNGQLIIYVNAESV